MFKYLKIASFLLFFTLLFPLNQVYAATVIKGDSDISLDIYGKIYGDFFYSYINQNFANDFLRSHQSSVYQDGDTSFLGSYAFLGSSNVGFTLGYKNFEATVELGLSDIIRKIFLKYTLNKDENHYLLIGKDWVLDSYTFFPQWSNDLQSLNDYGSLRLKRRLQLRYGIKGFEVAIILPSLQAAAFGADDFGYSSSNLQNNVFNTIPRLNIAYTLNKDNLIFKIFAGYGAYYYKTEVENALANQATLGMGGGVHLGRIARLDFTLFYALNGWLNSSIGSYHNPNGFLTPVRISGTKIYVDNIHSLGTALAFTFYALEGNLMPSLGIGVQAALRPILNGIVRRDIPFDIALGAFFNTRIKVASWLSIIPEVTILYDFNPMNMPNVDFSEGGLSLTAGLFLIAEF